MTSLPRRAQWGVAFAEARAVILNDVGPHDMYPTITNDAEAVVADLASSLEGRRLFYVDTEGRVDELLVAGGKFAGFAPGWLSLEAAIEALREPPRPIVDPLAERTDAFLRAVIAADDRALALCPFAWAAIRETNAPTIAVEIGTGPHAVKGAGETLAVAVRDALYSSPTLRARLIELENCP
jgi:hypothetical protein